MESECKKNKKYPKVIVLMSTYNGEQYIKEQIESILNQTYPNMELYIRDDGSKDQTVAILKNMNRMESCIFHREKTWALSIVFLKL